MTPKMMNYIRGTVRLQVSGSMPEKFINLCVAEQILLWGIMKKHNDFYVYMRLPDFFRIRPLTIKSRTRVKVVAHHGLPFTIKRVKRRKMLVAGALLFLIALHVLASYIWFVDIIGLKTLSSSRIRNVAYQHGLKPGILKELVSTKGIENAILLDIPEVAWVGVNFTGTRAVIEIVEKTMPKPEDKAPAHLVAAKDGVITEVITLLGQSMIKKGDIVKKGDILIKGVSGQTDLSAEQVGQENPLPANPEPQQLAKAKGIIKARVWYESYGEAELSAQVHKRTGQQSSTVLLKVGEREFVLKKAPEKPYDLFETEVIHKKLPGWRNSNFTVESTINVNYELVTSHTEITLEAAKDIARGKALSAVEGLIPETAQIVSRNIEVLQTAETNLVRVKVSVETVEDIGQSMPVIQ